MFLGGDTLNEKFNIFFLKCKLLERLKETYEMYFIELYFKNREKEKECPLMGETI